MEIFAHIYKTKDERYFIIQKIVIDKVFKKGHQTFWTADQMYIGFDGSYNIMKSGKSYRGNNKKDLLQQIK